MLLDMPSREGIIRPDSSHFFVKLFSPRGISSSDVREFGRGLIKTSNTFWFQKANQGRAKEQTRDRIKHS